MFAQRNDHTFQSRIVLYERLLPRQSLAHFADKSQKILWYILQIYVIITLRTYNVEIPDRRTAYVI